MIKLALADQKSKEVIYNLFQLYRYDMSEFTLDTPNHMGRYSYGKYFEHYWTEENRYPYLIVYSEKICGFALIREISDNCFSIAEFFILRNYRLKGVGKDVAFKLFDLHQGEWHVSQDKDNYSAQKFWRRVIGLYTNGKFQEGWSSATPEGPKQIFTSVNNG